MTSQIYLTSTSPNRGNLIEMIKVFGRLSVDISNVILENAPKSAMYTFPKIQKDILHILASKLRNKICDEVGDSKFCILVDESIDASQKEHMAIVLRFVDVYGIIRERFFDIVNVADTTSLTLKKEISNILIRNNLSIHNMRALVGAAEKEDSIWEFFSMLSNVVNIVIGSSKCLLALQTAHGIEVDNSVASGEHETGRGLNQIGNLQRSGSTRWISHFNYICSLIDKFGLIINLLENINNCSSSSNSVHGEARGSLKALKSFDFLFVLYLMHKIMGLTNLLCRALQSKSINILNAMDLVATTKELLQSLRDEGFHIFLDYVTSLEELHYRFNDEVVQLLRLSTSLEPKNNFSLFDIEHICALATTFYHADFG
ncbi:uncharacterized protein LOC141665970 [Apium graveolens]|uniref:uncharacterized protein LOC141665970 n=1 Tax=Apium graveolens TaxID=4045 RepID=UPI003D7A4564